MKRLRAICIATATALVTSLLLARTHPFGNAGLHRAAATPGAIMEHSSVPPDVRATLVAKCADCHSTQTQTPIYGSFAPVSWLMERDVIRGRKHMNLSLWDTYSADQQQIFKAKIVRLTKGREMPLPQYQMIHPHARITEADVRAFILWANVPLSADASPLGQSSGKGDPIQGREVFEKRCTGCHAMEQNREGPRLRGVFGRASGAVPGYPYSPALLKSHIIWNESSLEQWLADPDTLVPDNNMEMHVPRQQERRDLISFLKQSAN